MKRDLFTLDLRYRSYLFKRIISFLTYRLTVMGRLLVLAGCLVFLMGGVILLPTFMMYTVGFFFLMIFIFSPILSYIVLPRLILDVETPVRTSAGATFYEDVTVKNKSGKDAVYVFVREDNWLVDLKQEFPQGIMIPYLYDKDEVKFRINLTAEKRGVYKLDKISVDSPFPVGVVRVGYSYKKIRKILVYPAFKPLTQFNIPVGKKLQPGGILLASNIGESTEFLGTREFREGDSPRMIHWKSWARLDKPIVKEFQEEYFCRIALLIDTFIPKKSPEGVYNDFEALLSLGASISDYLSRQEYIIDIVAAGPQIYYLQAGRSLAYLDQILDILACIDVCRQQPYSRVEPVLMEEMARVTTVVVLLLDWDDARRDFLQRIRESGVELRVIIVNSTMQSGQVAKIEDMFGPVTLIDAQTISKGMDYL
ncbi:MAG: DUF58 domain-containing protein [Firmicutes bacterium]|nr:DUF58 domain-containing protein [Bacillota bacterium]